MCRTAMLHHTDRLPVLSLSRGLATSGGRLGLHVTLDHTLSLCATSDATTVAKSFIT